MTDTLFSTLSNIDPADQATWEGKIFLTFDIDWACDEVIEDSIVLVESVGAAATWFVTHETPLLERLRNNPAFELGIHLVYPKFEGRVIAVSYTHLTLPTIPLV